MTEWLGWGHTKGGKKVEAKAGVEKKWLMPDKWEGPFCPRCDKTMQKTHMKMRAKTETSARPIYECTDNSNPPTQGCGYAAYCDESALVWKKKSIDFFAIMKEFSAR
jgi:hypothetical protein